MTESRAEGKPVGRRVFLGMVGLGAAGIVWGSGVSDAISKLLRPITEHDSTGLSSLIPAAGRFRFYSVVGFSPSRTAETYQLTVSGLVKQPLTLSLADLQAMPQTRLVKDFQCVTGWRVPQVPWTGVTLSSLLDAAGVSPGAAAIRFTSFDGEYTESLTMEQARRPDVLVALQMEDKPITSAHGGPVRLYVAPMYGYKSCKWLDGIHVVDKIIPGYWEDQGYDVDAWIGRSNGRSDQPVT